MSSLDFFLQKALEEERGERFHGATCWYLLRCDVQENKIRSLPEKSTNDEGFILKTLEVFGSASTYLAHLILRFQHSGGLPLENRFLFIRRDHALKNRLHYEKVYSKDKLDPILMPPPALQEGMDLRCIYITLAGKTASLWANVLLGSKEEQLKSKAFTSMVCTLDTLFNILLQLRWKESYDVLLSKCTILREKRLQSPYSSVFQKLIERWTQKQYKQC